MAEEILSHKILKRLSGQVAYAVWVRLCMRTHVTKNLLIQHISARNLPTVDQECHSCTPHRGEHQISLWKWHSFQV